MIEGEGGIGKTVTLFSVAERTNGHSKVPAMYIPLFDLIDENGKSLSLTKYLQNKIPEIANAICTLAAKPWRGPSLLLLLDGFNEIPAANRMEILNLLKDWRKYHPGAQFIAVSRPLSGINLAHSLEEGAKAIQLKPLEKKAVQDYIRDRMPDRILPSEDAEIWNFLIYPLFLTLYLKTEFPEMTAYSYPLSHKEASGRGGIIWNYLQRELLKIASEAWVIRCAVACEYILPQIAYEMSNHYQFTIGETALFDLIQKAVKTLEPTILPVHLGEVYDSYRGNHPGRFPNLEQFDWNVVIVQETGLLTEYQEYKKNAGTKRAEKRYAFIHQHFCDCLAGIYLMNQAEMAEKNTLPEVWKYGQSPLALDYAAELMSSETFQKLWESNRHYQRDGMIGYGRCITSTYTLLELRKRRGMSSLVLDFSGMDLRDQSLSWYMGQGGEGLNLFRQAQQTNKTKLNCPTFQSEGHDDSVICMAILPNWRVVSGSADATLRVWDVASGQCLQTMKGHKGRIICVDILPDGQVVSGSADHTLRIWDTSSGKCLKKLEGHTSNINCVTILPDGRIVSVSKDRTLRIWEPFSERKPQILEGHTGNINCVAAFPDGRVVSGSDDHILRIWDTVKGHCCQILKGHTNQIKCVAVLPDERVISGSKDHTLRIWDAATGRCLHVLEGHENRINCINVLPNGMVVSCSDDGTLRTWDADNGYCLNSLKANADWISCLAILPNGQAVSGSNNHTLQVWDIGTGKCIQTLKGHTDWIKCMSILPDGRVVSGSFDRTLRVWDAETGECHQTLTKQTSMINCATVLQDGRVISCSNGSMLRIWDLTTGYSLPLKVYKERIKCVTALQNGMVVTGSDDGALRIWEITTSRCLQILNGHTGTINSIADLQDGRVVSGSNDGTLKIWDSASGKCLQTLKGHTNKINCVALYLGGRVVSGSDDTTLRIWDTTTGECLQTLAEHTGSINCVAVNSNGLVIFGSYDKTLRIWDPRSFDTNDKTIKLEGLMSMINCVATLPDGRVVGGSDHCTLRIWDAATGKCLQTLKGHANSINCVAVLSDGRVISGSDDGTLRIWDPNTGNCLVVLEVMEVDVSQMNFSQARLNEELAKLLWHNGATISQADYERWVKPRQQV